MRLVEGNPKKNPKARRIRFDKDVLISRGIRIRRVGVGPTSKYNPDGIPARVRKGKALR